MIFFGLPGCDYTPAARVPVTGRQSLPSPVLVAGLGSVPSNATVPVFWMLPLTLTITLTVTVKVLARRKVGNRAGDRAAQRSDRRSGADAPESWLPS